ncbi:ABC transporter ATP-binding protein [Lihuaxuella thermophila]|uniref:Putative ABC transport system ATP-binding protein n=1 Tax=Lihuaxuella thermophila TaxID=1173111 RepID=A0A1H8HU24_9BACL|nr:ABC transporter ATP-binding protein [Lihuaxuella thermophila]SEN59188.1 putative ABC transport system ATP-binding protein [Lihuaxuella thermophila]
MIELKGIFKSYQAGHLQIPVLKNIHLTIDEGEYVAIMGPSGSGKSTLMNIIGCLDRPSEGTYFLNGRDVFKEDDTGLAAVRNRTIGFVFQQFQLLPRMDAQKNVELPLVYAGVSKAERKKRALEALRRVGLEDRKSHRPSELSGGQQQRVAIARALVTQPLVLLADEPTGALDSHSSGIVLDLFDELHQEGRTVVLITHDPEVAERAQRQLIIRDGELIADQVRAGGKRR